MGAERNQVAWDSKRIAEDYADRRELFAAERAILHELWTEIPDRRVLDLGVGGGRTTAWLNEVSDAYVAIDYSPRMVAMARESNPTADIRHGDARHLESFPAGSFTLVLFSFNGIDYVPYADRRLVLREAYRVLEPGGYFLFSTHNIARLEGRVRGSYKVDPVGLTANPVRSGVRLARWMNRTARGYRSFRKLRSSEVAGEGYVALNDGACGYALLTCYVDPVEQIVELGRAGFAEPPRVFDVDGEPGSIDSTDPWLYFLVCKPRASDRA